MKDDAAQAGRLQPIDDRRVIVIGASSGIGLELAQSYLRRGCRVALTGRRHELLSEAAKQWPANSYVRQMDVSDQGAAAASLKDLIHEMGGADIVIISAGTGYVNLDLAWEKERDTIDVNVAGFAAMANVAMTHFLDQNAGQLVGITSIAGLRGMLDCPAYGASKAFMSNYLEALRLKVLQMHSPITVTEIQPGFVDTAMAQGDGLFWVASVEKAAAQISRAIDRKRKHAYITRRWRLVAWALKLLPEWLLARLYRSG